MTIPAHIRGVTRSSPSIQAKTATTVGTVARMSELLPAVVWASPRMNASWYSVFPTTPRATSRQRSPGASGAGGSISRTTSQSSPLASTNRIAVNGSAGIWSIASFVTAKLTPQMRHTTSIPAS